LESVQCPKGQTKGIHKGRQIGELKTKVAGRGVKHSNRPYAISIIFQKSAGSITRKQIEREARNRKKAFAPRNCSAARECDILFDRTDAERALWTKLHQQRQKALSENRERNQKNREKRYMYLANKKGAHRATLTPHTRSLELRDPSTRETRSQREMMVEGHMVCEGKGARRHRPIRRARAGHCDQAQQPHFRI